MSLIELLSCLTFFVVIGLAAARQFGVGESYVLDAAKDSVVVLHGIEGGRVCFLGFCVEILDLLQLQRELSLFARKGLPFS